MTIKALPTTYKGVTYRSRTEARWAVFFDILRIEAIHEGEGFDLDGIWYLPDFWLRESKTWFEIKGTEPTTAENEKARRLAALSGNPVVIAIGHPSGDSKATSLRIFAGALDGKSGQLADYGPENIFVTDGTNPLIALKGSEANLGGAADPCFVLKAARQAQAERFGQ